MTLIYPAFKYDGKSLNLFGYVTLDREIFGDFDRNISFDSSLTLNNEFLL